MPENDVASSDAWQNASAWSPSLLNSVANSVVCPIVSAVVTLRPRIWKKEIEKMLVEYLHVPNCLIGTTSLRERDGGRRSREYPSEILCVWTWCLFLFFSLFWLMLACPPVVSSKLPECSRLYWVWNLKVEWKFFPVSCSQNLRDKPRACSNLWRLIILLGWLVCIFLHKKPFFLKVRRASTVFNAAILAAARCSG